MPMPFLVSIRYRGLRLSATFERIPISLLSLKGFNRPSEEPSSLLLRLEVGLWLLRCHLDALAVEGVPVPDNRKRPLIRELLRHQ